MNLENIKAAIDSALPAVIVISGIVAIIAGVGLLVGKVQKGIAIEKQIFMDECLQDHKRYECESMFRR